MDILDGSDPFLQVLWVCRPSLNFVQRCPGLIRCRGLEQSDNYTQVSDT